MTIVSEQSTTVSSTSPVIDLSDFSIRPVDGGNTVDYRGLPDDMPCKPGALGLHHGAVLVRLDVDGEWSDVVNVAAGRSSDLSVLRRVIDTLIQVRDQIERMVPEDQRWAGQCMASGDWGRCEGREGHGGDHDFPTEEEWKTTRLPQVVKRTA